MPFLIDYAGAPTISLGREGSVTLCELVEKGTLGLRTARDRGLSAPKRRDKARTLAPKVAAMRAAGTTWREIGETLSERRGQAAALWAINVQRYAKKCGWWPSDSISEIITREEEA